MHRREDVNLLLLHNAEHHVAHEQSASECYLAFVETRLTSSKSCYRAQQVFDYQLSAPPSIVRSFSPLQELQGKDRFNQLRHLKTSMYRSDSLSVNANTVPSYKILKSASGGLPSVTYLRLYMSELSDTSCFVNKFGSVRLR